MKLSARQTAFETYIYHALRSPYILVVIIGLQVLSKNITFYRIVNLVVLFILQQLGVSYPFLSKNITDLVPIVKSKHKEQAVLGVKLY